jgi:site-specific DNA recombinase
MQAEGLSIGLQQSQIQQFCENKGWDLVHIYVDEGHSAKNFNRPDFKQLLEDMKRGRFSVIVITRVDRLVRSLRHLLRFIRDRLEPAGVRVVSIAEDIDTGDISSKSRNVLVLMGIPAELERQVIRERVIPAVQAAAKSGRVGTHRRYGYRTDNKGNIKVDPGERKVVQGIFKWAGERNLSITAIANRVRD